MSTHNLVCVCWGGGGGGGGGGGIDKTYNAPVIRNPGRPGIVGGA